MQLDPHIAAVAALSITPAIFDQLVPPAYSPGNAADPRRYQRAAGVSIGLGFVLAVAGRDWAPLALAAGTVGALVALREWSLNTSSGQTAASEL